MGAFSPIRLNGREIGLHKGIINQELDSRTVLTNSPWDFVQLWLKREKKDRAFFYWNQAREFSLASEGLGVQSAPLLHYYSFLNAVKALLASKEIRFKEYHGVQAAKVKTASRKISLTNEVVKIKNDGVFPSFSEYLNEKETSKTHTLQELLFNLPFIHRTYCLTYSSQREMFVPIREGMFVADKKNKQAFFQAKLSKDFSSKHVINRLPQDFDLDSKNGPDYTIRSREKISYSKPSRPTKKDLERLKKLQQTLRKDLFYINGAQTLWYVRAKTSGPSRLSRYSCTITLAAMHRLSELCRYHPLEFDSFLSGRQNWLLTEFIKQSPIQFFDEIATEITGHQFMIPNVRPAS
ncbi:YaaC family protein [Nitrospina watsonii]|uniref:YaaC-like Protein n=1 Tax=Nitrospina watsonii TaxID=1323948 RepID=A0ABN8W1I1_9BACT|nr:YaaC family protein [Nitrospina watsonii]CAI2719483.1 conserved protein of unknown function [Nitrospina watsonii]